ncbi:MAG: SDR family NAD(P)-dependent oxidoreductase, partial [Gammaproteobacteria bacterium]|nr:SDR family NAD(P)-dependent oxidoreductase [Gammaproteobacteria bacterium]
MKSSSSQSKKPKDTIVSKSGQAIRKKPDRENKETDIAIIGMACRFPGAKDYRQFWQNLVSGVDSVTEIPPERWDWRAYWGDPLTEPNKTNSRWGGFIEDVDKFDASFFNISPREAELMDPQQRILLELSFACIEDAGYRPSALLGSKTGVFIGLCNYDYKELQERYCSQIEGHLLTGTANTIVPNRLSYHFNLHGPSVSVDTACSSSLVALHQAVQAMEHGECHLCLVGGINILVSPERYIPFSKLNMLSPTGRCRTFDQQADGYVRGEGAGVILLKRLDRALDDRDQIYGIIKGSAVNHGGQARTLTSPNAFAQSQVIVEAYHRAGVLPTTINYIETHGTGTPLGDPIEIHSLKRAVGKLFKELDQEPQAGYCGLGAVKTNIGHLEAAAGMAGVIKVLLAMKHKKLPGINHFSDLNPRIKLEDSPFYLVEESKNWEAVTNKTGKVWPRRAGVSSFGFGGTNAHLIVEEYQGLGVRSQELGEGPQLIVLSAKNEERLRESAARLLAYLEQASSLPVVEQALSGVEGTPAIEQTLREMVSKIIGVDPTEIEQPFEGYGLDPMQLSRLKTMAEERYHCELPIALFSEQSSVESVAQHLTSPVAEGERKNQAVPQPAPSLTSIAYTLQVGREAMDSRLAFVAHDLDDVRLKLTDFLENNTENIYYGWLKANKEGLDLLTEGDEAKVFVEMLIKGGKLEKLAQLWVSGVDVEWTLLYPNHKPGRISLPTYPFARERYWLPEMEEIVVDLHSTDVVPSTNRIVSYLKPIWQSEPLNTATRAAKIETFLVLVGLESSLNKTISTIFKQTELVILETTEPRTLAATVSRDIQQMCQRLKNRLETKPTSPRQVVILATPADSLRAAALIGFLRSAQQEHPNLRSKVVTIAELNSRNVKTILRQEVAAEIFTAAEVRYDSAGKRAIKTYILLEQNNQNTLRFKTGGVYWITGGMGGLGRILAQHILEQLPEITLILSGRSALDKARQQQLAAMNQNGQQVVYLPGDVSQQAEVEQIVQTIKAHYGPLKGIIHSAGVSQDSLLLNKTAQQIEAVLEPKVAGLINIDYVTQDEPLDFVVLFSSLAGVMGNIGQTDYSAANAFMDGFAHHRQQLVTAGQRTGQTVAINWPLWAAGGMQIDPAEQRLLTHRTGLVPLTTTEGIQALYDSLTSEESQIIVAVGDIDKHNTWLQPRDQPARDTGTSSSDLNPEGLKKLILANLKQQVSQITKIKPDQLDVAENLGAFGVDSIMLKQLAVALEQQYGVELSPAIFFEYSDLNGLAKYLAEQHSRPIATYYQDQL